MILPPARSTGITGVNNGATLVEELPGKGHPDTGKNVYSVSGYSTGDGEVERRSTVSQYGILAIWFTGKTLYRFEGLEPELRRYDITAPN